MRTHERHDGSLGRTGIIVLLGLLADAGSSFLMAQEFPADVNRGKTVYEQHCLRCHGVGGWGDGPEAGSLKVAPVNFHRFSSYLKSDEELQRAIEHGLVFSPMHSWQGRLTETEIRDVIDPSACCPNKAPSIYNFAVQAIGRRLTENSSTTLDAQHSRTRWGPMHP